MKKLVINNMQAPKTLKYKIIYICGYNILYEIKYNDLKCRKYKKYIIIIEN